MKKKVWIILLAVVITAGFSSGAFALSSYLNALRTKYATPTNPLGQLDSCNTCHPGGNTGSLNQFAQDFASASHTFSAALEAKDSDGDGFTNLAEITARTFPGDATSYPAATTDTTAPVVSFTMPATASSLTVAIMLSATDAVGVTGYMVKENTTAPTAATAGWVASAPASYTFASAGVKNLYAWAMDNAGIVSARASASTTISLPDATAPVVSFSMLATASSLTVAITLSATDAVGVTGYMVKENTTAPTAATAGWVASAPASYTFASAGAKNLYAWAKDNAGNVSAMASASTTITLPDATAPVVSFSMPATASSLTVAITLSATDAVGVTGYMVKENTTAPTAATAGWVASAPASYTFASAGVKNLYAWAKDNAGNVSAMASASTTITLPDATAPVVSFSMLATASSLTVAITLSATDAVGVTGYMVKENTTAPTAATTGWVASAPSSYTFASAGAKNLYAWAKDNAGNVSAMASASTTITLSDPGGTTPPDTTGPDMAIWQDQWFKVTVKNEGYFMENIGLSGDRHKISAYIKILDWNPEANTFQATLYTYDSADSQWLSVSMPLQYTSGTNLNFLVSSQVNGQVTYGFTARIKGARTKAGALKSGTFKTLAGYHVQATSQESDEGSAGSVQEEDLSGWLKITGNRILESKIPAAILSLP